MADKKPLVAGQSPAVVQQIGSGDVLEVPAIKLGTPLSPQFGGLGADASLWASGKIPVFDGTKFGPGDPSGGSLPVGEKDQILVMGASGPEWGGATPLDASWIPTLEFVGMYREGDYYTTSQAIFAMANNYGYFEPIYLTPINDGIPSYPDVYSNVHSQWDTNPPETWHEWQELAWPTSSPRFVLGQSASAGDAATAIGQSAYAGDAATAIGQSASAGDAATAIGQSASAGDAATAIGQSASAGYAATALGQSASAGYAATALGRSASAGDAATAIGQSASAGDAATAIGMNTQASYLSIALGIASSAEYFGSMAVGITAHAAHERSAVLGAVDEYVSYQPSTTADRRITVDYQELEVTNQGEGGQTSVILVDEVGGQWRISVNSSGVISASAV